MAMFELPLSP